MKSSTRSRVGKWSVFGILAALVIASGQACPPGMAAASLAGLWTGTIQGEVTLNELENMPQPPNPNPETQENTSHQTREVQIVFDGTGRPTTLPLALSAFSTSISDRAVTAFNVGEMQTITSEFSQTFPSGAADATTNESTSSTILTVTESTLTADHFRVVYALNNTSTSNTTSTAVGFMPSSSTLTSTGTLTFDALATGGFVVFSMDFNLNGTGDIVDEGVPRTSGGFLVGSLNGTLAAD